MSHGRLVILYRKPHAHLVRFIDQPCRFINFSFCVHFTCADYPQIPNVPIQALIGQ